MSPNNEHAARLRDMAIDWDNALNKTALLAGAEALERQERDLDAIKAADAALTEAMETISDLRGSLEVAKAALEAEAWRIFNCTWTMDGKSVHRILLADQHAVATAYKAALARLEGK
jgi:hypothetical protein